MHLTRSTLCQTGIVLTIAAATSGIGGAIAQATTVELGSPVPIEAGADISEATSKATREATREATIAQTPAPAPAPAPGPAPAGANEPQLFERATFINACRLSGTQPINLSADVRRNQFLRTIPANTRLTLTGVIAYNNTGGVQFVQISQPAVGYVPTATLTLCTPTPTPTTRYRVITPGGLLARNTPNGTSQNDGPAQNAIVTDVSPAQVQNAGDRRWRLVNYTGIAGNTRQGWVAETGPGFVGQNLLPQ